MLLPRGQCLELEAGYVCVVVVMGDVVGMGIGSDFHGDGKPQRGGP